VRRVGGSMAAPDVGVINPNGFVYVGQGAVEVTDINTDSNAQGRRRPVQLTSANDAVNVGGSVNATSLFLNGATGGAVYHVVQQSQHGELRHNG
jgi:hypothetical protein